MTSTVDMQQCRRDGDSESFITGEDLPNLPGVRSEIYIFFDLFYLAGINIPQLAKEISEQDEKTCDAAARSKSTIP